MHSYFCQVFSLNISREKWIQVAALSCSLFVLWLRSRPTWTVSLLRADGTNCSQVLKLVTNLICSAIVSWYPGILRPGDCENVPPVCRGGSVDDHKEAGFRNSIVEEGKQKKGNVEQMREGGRKRTRPLDHQTSGLSLWSMTQMKPSLFLHSALALLTVIVIIRGLLTWPKWQNHASVNGIIVGKCDLWLSF